MKPICLYCNTPALLVTGDVIYPHRPDLFRLKFWNCKPCGAYVGCHPPSKMKNGEMTAGDHPLGRLANAELRTAKKAAHAAFDPIWMRGALSRKDAYKWLAEVMGISRKDAHIGMFDVDQCRAVVAAVKARA